MQYVQDYDGYYPAWERSLAREASGTAGGTPLYWQTALEPYVKSGNTGSSSAGSPTQNTGVWKCPNLGTANDAKQAASGGNPFSY